VKALVIAGTVQGFSTSPLMLLIMVMTNNPAVMGKRGNGRAIIILGWIATTTIFVASLDLIASYFVDGPVIDSRKIHHSNREKWHSTFK